MGVRFALMAVFGLVAACFACVPPSGDRGAEWDEASARDAMEDLVRRWDEAMASGEVENAAALYVTDDPSVMPPDRAAHVGPVGVEVFFRNMFADGGIEVSNRADRVLWSGGDVVIARGTYAWKSLDETGKWTAIATRTDDGSLAIRHNLWNRDSAPPGSEPTPSPAAIDPPAAADAPPCPDSPRALDEAFATYWAKADVPTMVALHAEQGSRLPPRRPILTGRDEIGAFLQSRIEYFSSGRLLFLDTGEEIDGDLGCTWGRYNVVSAFAGRMTPFQRIQTGGKYIAVAKRGGDGCWRYEWVIWNNDEPWPQAGS